MGNSARLRVDDQERSEGNEVVDVSTPAAHDQRRDEEHEQVLVRRQAEPVEPDRKHQRDDKADRGGDDRAAFEVWARRAPLLGFLAVGLAVLVRAPFWNAPLTADEGGYAEVARLWSHGATLYRGAWVDRPQGLILVFRALHLIGGSPLAMRAAAAVFAALVVAATMLLTLRLARGRTPPVRPGLLAETAGPPPSIDPSPL